MYICVHSQTKRLCHAVTHSGCCAFTIAAHSLRCVYTAAAAAATAIAAAEAENNNVAGGSSFNDDDFFMKMQDDEYVQFFKPKDFFGPSPALPPPPPVGGVSGLGQGVLLPKPLSSSGYLPPYSVGPFGVTAPNIITAYTPGTVHTWKCDSICYIVWRCVFCSKFRQYIFWSLQEYLS